MKALVPLADGFEEIEAVTVIDILRRAGIETVTAAIKNNPVKGAHLIPITADIIFSENDNYDAIVLPGGMPGSTNLQNDSRIINLIQKINKSGGLTAAICAAPIVLSKAGILNGCRFTCFPGYENGISEGKHTKENVVSDGSIITGIGAGCAALFAIEIVSFLKDKETAEKVKKQLIAFW